MNKNIQFEVNDISKTFNRRKIFSDISFSLKQKESLVITGNNGSGKSTLLKICAGVLTPTKGKTIFFIDGKPLDNSYSFRFIGFVAPYLQLYDEFTGWENLQLACKLHEINDSRQAITPLLHRLRLWERRNDVYKTYSSGMKQRLKYAFALVHEPPVLFLDEPASNLDQQGSETICEIMKEQKQEGILIVATNDEHDIGVCDRVINLNVQRSISGVP